MVPNQVKSSFSNHVQFIAILEITHPWKPNSRLWPTNLLKKNNKGNIFWSNLSVNEKNGPSVFRFYDECSSDSHPLESAKLLRFAGSSGRCCSSSSTGGKVDCDSRRLKLVNASTGLASSGPRLTNVVHSWVIGSKYSTLFKKTLPESREKR